MPFVKPTTTGRGMNCTAVPSPVTPAATSSTPAIIVHMNRPVDAVLGDDAADDHHERAGRAADLVARAAERRDQEAGDDRAVDARLRLQPGRDRESHGQRERDQPDGDAGDQVHGKHPAGVAAQVEEKFRSPVVHAGFG